MIADYENKYLNQNRSPWIDETLEYYENKAELELLILETMSEELDDDQEFESDWMEYQAEYNYCEGVV